MRGWTHKPLGELCQFINGLWKGEQPPFVHVGVIRNTNFNKDGTLDDSDIAYLDVEAKKFAKRRLEYGDLILEKSGGGPKQPVGRVVLFDKTAGDYSFSNFTSAIRLLDGSTLTPAYLHRYLHWVYVSGRTEAMQSHSTGIRNLNADAYREIVIAYPSVAEQHHIVALLDKGFDAIAAITDNTEKNLRNVEELRVSRQAEAMREAALGSELECLEDLVAPDCTLSYGIVQPGDDVDDGLPVVRPVDLIAETVQVAGLKRIDPKLATPYSRTTLKGNDLLLCVRGTTGTVAIAHQSLAGANVTRGIVPIRFNPARVSPRLGYYLLRSQSVQAQIRSKTYGAALMQINIGDLRKILIAVPPLKRQEPLVSLLDDIEAAACRLQRTYAQKLRELDQLKKSLLNAAFTSYLTGNRTDKRVAAVA